MMNPLNRRIIDDWHRVALSGDCSALDGMIHEDAVFESPVVHTPQRGKAITMGCRRCLEENRSTMTGRISRTGKSGEFPARRQEPKLHRRNPEAVVSPRSPAGSCHTRLSLACTSFCEFN